MATTLDSIIATTIALIKAAATEAGDRVYDETSLPYPGSAEHPAVFVFGPSGSMTADALDLRSYTTRESLIIQGLVKRDDGETDAQLITERRLLELQLKQATIASDDWLRDTDIQTVDKIAVRRALGDATDRHRGAVDISMDVEFTEDTTPEAYGDAIDTVRVKLDVIRDDTGLPDGTIEATRDASV
jgi:hypothetical protein